MNRIRQFLFVTLRVWKYRWLSDCRSVAGRPTCYHPLLLKGKGYIAFGQDVQVGVIASSEYYSHYAYLEARHPDARIEIGNRVALNNAFTAIAFDRITIGDDTLIGSNCRILDSDAHDLTPGNRLTGQPATAPVTIGKGVFIGSNVTLLKGVTIGDNAVIGHSAVVTKDVPANAIAAGNPARVIRTL